MFSSFFLFFISTATTTSLLNLDSFALPIFNHDIPLLFPDSHVINILFHNDPFIRKPHLKLFVKHLQMVFENQRILIYDCITYTSPIYGINPVLRFDKLNVKSATVITISMHDPLHNLLRMKLRGCGFLLGRASKTEKNYIHAFAKN